MCAHLPTPAALRSERASRFGLSVVVVAWGAQAIVTQSLLLREALVLMFGSELAWGIVLFAWLLGVAVGAYIGEGIARTGAGTRAPGTCLAIVLLALSAAACVELWAFRGARAWLGVEAGELLSLPTTALAAMLLVSPTSMLVGMAFPLACNTGGISAAPGAPRTPLLSFARVYALECVGSLIGGAAFSFWAVESLRPIQIALLCGAITAASCAVLLRRAPGRAWYASPPSWALIGLAVGAAGVALLAGDRLDHRLVQRRWQTLAPGYRLVAEAESRYQNLAIGHRAGQYTLYCDGQVAADFPDPFTFAPRAHFWMCQHPLPRRVLILGGGVEGLLAEVLLHPVERVDYVELDPRFIELVRPYVSDRDRQALVDARVTVHHDDARHFIKTQRAQFDLVIARLPEPMSAQRARFYTDEFFAELRNAMTARAVFCTNATASEGALSPAARDYLAGLRATLARHFREILIGWGNPAQILAATDRELLSTDPAELAARYTRRHVAAELFDPLWFEGGTDWLDESKIAGRRADLDRADLVQISTDLHPAIYLQRLVLWESITRGGSGPGRSAAGPIAALRSIHLWHVAVALALLGGATLLLTRLRRGAGDGWAAGAVTLSVGTTGFVTMALSMVWLFAFQSLYGYVYQRIGWIIALFMAGLVIGCALAGRRRNVPADMSPPNAAGGAAPQNVAAGASPAVEVEQTHNLPPQPAEPTTEPPARRSSSWHALVVVDLLLTLLALTASPLLMALGAFNADSPGFALVEVCISIMVLLTGVLGGAAFALAGHLRRNMDQHPAVVAARIVGPDHAGACLGALTCGILLIPVFGITTTACLLAAIKLASTIILSAGRKHN